MGEILGKREGLLGSRECLVWIAQQPQDLHGVHPTGDSWVLPIAEGMGAVPLGVIERDALFHMSERRRELASPFQRVPCR